MTKFNAFGVQYTLDPENNKDIKIFHSFVEGFASGKWEQNTFEVFERCKDPNKAAIDIGAWIGPTAIWLSNNFKQVVAVDADIKAVEALRQNLITSNCSNVFVVDKPIHSENSEVVFGANEYVELFKQEGLGCSTSQIKMGQAQGDDYATKTITLSDLNGIVPLNEVGFVKVDIEGGEEYILEDLSRLGELHGWKLWVSFHYDWWKDRNIARFKDLFSKAKFIGYNGVNTPLYGNFTEYITNSSFASLYIEF